MQHHRLFHRTRWHITGFYAAIIGSIALLSAYGIHLGTIRVFERTVDRELNTLAGTLHDTLEAVLIEPEVIDPMVVKLLPGLCLIDRPCIPIANNYKLKELTQQQGYCLRLLNLEGHPIATLGSTEHKFNDRVATHNWQTITDDRGERYHLHTLPLKTSDGKNWGYLQVAQSYRKLDEYMASLHTIALVGIPLGMLAIGGVSWWLSGLAIQPIYRFYQQMQQFTADAAHELRTPLSVTRVAIESALDPLLPVTEVHQNLEVAQRQIHHLTRLAEDLLWLSRLETKKSNPDPQSCCLNDLVTDLEEELAPLALVAKIDLRLEILPQDNCYVRGDSDQLYRAISNLITNAIQCTPKGGIVTIRLTSADDRAIITVTDTGIGISPEDLSQIFDRFYRVQADRARQTGGTGLGLAIVRAIIMAHQGTIQVTSEPGHGSTFTVKLLLEKARV
jgi:signal transduction histidine kinase